VFEASALVSVDNSLPPYRTGNFAWVRYLLGGLMFGIGMTLASGCGNKTLIRIGGGNIKSMVVFLVAGFFAYLMTKTDFYAIVFHQWVQALSIDLTEYGMKSQDIAALMAAFFGIESLANLRIALGGLIAFALLLLVVRSADFRSRFDNILGGAVVGAAVLGAWYITGGPTGQEWLENAEWLDEKPINVGVQSYTFINPMGETLAYLVQPTNTLLISFGVVALFGVIVGSFAYAVVTRSFHIEWFSSLRDFITHMIGAVLMGIGGVLAMGCTIGQAITGISTLAAGSILTFVAIVFGSALTMKYQYYKLLYEQDATLIKTLVTALVDFHLLPGRMRKLEAV
jgi:uncharacterized protein